MKVMSISEYSILIQQEQAFDVLAKPFFKKLINKNLTVPV